MDATQTRTQSLKANINYIRLFINVTPDVELKIVL